MHVHTYVLTYMCMSCACGSPRLMPDALTTLHAIYSGKPSTLNPELDDWAHLASHLTLRIPYLYLPSAEITDAHHMQPTSTCVLGSRTLVSTLAH